MQFSLTLAALKFLVLRHLPDLKEEKKKDILTFTCFPKCEQGWVPFPLLGLLEFCQLVCLQWSSA